MRCRMRSGAIGAIGNNGTTYLMASVKKAGTVSFWWKAQCEEPDEEVGEDGYYGYGAFLVVASSEPVPYSWLRKYNLGVASGDFEAAASGSTRPTRFTGSSRSRSRCRRVQEARLNLWMMA